MTTQKEFTDTIRQVVASMRKHYSTTFGFYFRFEPSQLQLIVVDRSSLGYVSNIGIPIEDAMKMHDDGILERGLVKTYVQAIAKIRSRWYSNITARKGD